MHKIEELMKRYLQKNLNSLRPTRTPYCPDEKVLLDYMERKLNKDECQIIEGHIANCGFCLTQLNVAFEAQGANKYNEFPGIPQELMDKAKGLMKTNRDTGGSRMTRAQKIKKNLFLIGAGIFFALSFLIPKYFIQFLVATLILGIRWALESESGHTFIMVLDSWRRHSHKDDEEISRRLKNRF